MSAGIIIFRSAACADVIYFADVAHQLMNLMGKEPGEQGIVTVEQIPAAIACLRQAIAEDKERQLRQMQDEEQEDGDCEAAEKEAKPPTIGLSQRAFPLLLMLEESLAERKPVVWGV